MPSLRQQHMGAYNVWKAARQRCNNPNNKDFHHYGGRGIKFKFESFDAFINHIGARPEGMTLERVDNEKHYEPGNVKWAPWSDQRSNKRTTKVLTFQGQSLTLKEWAQKLGLSYWTLRCRYDKGWAVEDVLKD